MLLTISTTHSPATDLGYVLHKNPTRLQSEKMSFGTAYVFYPEATDERCTVELLMEIDPIGLVTEGTVADLLSPRKRVGDRPRAPDLASEASRTLDDIPG
jgi:Hen1-like subunit of RNA repair complex